MFVRDESAPLTTSAHLERLADDFVVSRGLTNLRLRFLYGIGTLFVGLVLYTLCVCDGGSALLLLLTSIGVLFLAVYLRRNGKRRSEARLLLVRFLTGGEREVLARAAGRVLADVTGSDFFAVLALARALERPALLESAAEKRVRFHATASIHSLLVGIGSPQLRALEGADRAFLRRELLRWSNRRSGWYLDGEYPIRLLLSLATAQEPGMEPYARSVIQRDEETRLAEAAREYLLSLAAVSS